jgi:hypothetical protein
VDVEGAKWLRRYADKHFLLLKKAEERWQEQYDNDPRGAWFRQMEPKMVCTTSVTQLRLKWTLRDAPRRILSKIVPEWPWLGGGVVSAFQEERTRRNLTVPVVLSKLSSIFSSNVCCLKRAVTFLERFLQHWRNESCWGPREASRLWRNSRPSSREIFSLRVRQLTSTSGGSREFPSPPSLDNGRRFGVKDCFGLGALDTVG